jgi:adenylate cyclase
MNPRLRSRRLVILVADLTGFHQSFSDHDDETMAGFIDRFYADTHELITRHGGTVVKFMGDAVLSVFPERGAANAIDAIFELKQRLPSLAGEFGLQLDLMANIHAAQVIEGEFGVPGYARYDAIGAGINQTFKMGRGIGLRISEAVYQQLAAARRSSWRKSEIEDVYQYVLTDALDNYGAGL